jgi:sigma-54 specific flagellar transcriptional regulator A
MKASPRTHIIGQSQATQFLRELIQTLSASSSTALITGESGTGKELVAQALHHQGPRATGAFVPINCGAIPRDLIESELFGHRKGAFTGAVGDRLGRFELAHGGTLFLDEIGDLPMDMQVKLLRVLQERCILPVGASREVPIDVRVVAATHKKLEDEVAAGRFREDLYYRINVLPITTTPLRERPDDIAALLQFYADRHVLPGARAVRFAPDMLQMMQAYHWPGNVRELSNLVDRFSTLYPSQTLQVHTVPSCMLPSGLAVLQAVRIGQQTSAVANALSAMFTPEPIQAAGSSVSLADAPVAQHAPEQGLSGASFHAAPDRVHLSNPEPAPWLHADDPLAHLFGADGLADGLPPPARAMSSPAPFTPVNVSASNDEMNAVEEVILLAQGIQSLPPDGLSLKQHLIDIERSLIEQALSRTQGNVSQTAKLLQLQRTTLIEKINKYELRGLG